MNKTNTWLITVFAVVLICVCLIAYLNSQKKPSLLRPKPSIEDLEYRALDKKRANAEVAYSGKWHIAGCMPDMPTHRTWGCCNCDAAFWKDSAHNLERLGEFFTVIWPKE